MPLQYPRQIPAPRTAWIIHIVRNLLRALGCQFIEPIDELGIAATFLDEPRKEVATISTAFGAVHAQHIELADEMSAIGTKRTSQVAPHMSAIGGKADMAFCAAHVCF